MDKSLFVIAGAAAVAACSAGGDTANNSANAAANEAAAAAPKHPTYCFFPDKTSNKDWVAKTDKDGNVTVTGKAHLDDRRYMAALTQPDVKDSTASVWLTMPQNNTGFGAQGDWWDVSYTIPNSAAVTTVNVMCGSITLATLQVPRTNSGSPTTNQAGANG